MVAPKAQQKKKRSWVRKAPMISKGRGRKTEAGLDEGSMRTSEMMNLSDKASDKLYSEIKVKFLKFLSGVTKEPWGESQFYRRFYLFGEYVTCVRWQDTFYITGSEIFKAQRLMHRLVYKEQVKRPRRFEEAIMVQLRGMDDAGVRIEEAGSKLMALLAKLGAVRTRRRQKIFSWDAIDHAALFSSITMAREVSLAEGKDLPTKKGYEITSLKIFKPNEGMDALIHAISAFENE